jgi:hypothetical protein
MADTASPWPGPGGVAWATSETASPWLLASSGHTTLVAGLAAGWLVLLVGASLDDVVGASLELLVVDRATVVDVVEDVDVVDDDVVGSSDGTRTVDGPDGPFQTLAAAAVTPPTISAAPTPMAASLRA